MERVIFALAQYTPDLLRQEPRNIGVFVASSTRVLGRFLGEDESGIVRPARLPVDMFIDVDLYIDWHQYWSGLLQRELAHGTAFDFVQHRLIRNKRKAFAVVNGGEYDANPDETLESIAASLFKRLVLTEPAETARLSTSASEVAGGYLGRRLLSEFKRIGILERSRGSENLFVRHPVRPKVSVKGLNPVPHTADFYQENGRRYVMEHVDFSIQTLGRARDHAMLSHYILADIAHAAEFQSDELPPVHPIAIVNRIAASDSRIQDYALAALASVPGLQIVYWDRDDERKRFLEERRSVAEVMGIPDRA
jgi:hypothetical protein